MFKTIVVAVDGSEGSRKAIRYGAQMQAQYEGELLMLTVFRHHSLLEGSMSMVRPQTPENIDDAMRGYAREVADEAKVLAREAGATKFRAFIKSGQPARTIVKFSADHGADLIVVGSRGMGDIEGFLLGSVSHKVTSLASCPVLVV